MTATREDDLFRLTSVLKAKHYSSILPLAITFARTYDELIPYERTVVAIAFQTNVQLIITQIETLVAIVEGKENIVNSQNMIGAAEMLLQHTKESLAVVCDEIESVV
eukprot:PhF_6_TR23596/c0_g1_i1/m.33111